MQLQRVVEAAGMTEHVDYVLQASVADGDTRVRPDLVVQLPGGKQLVVQTQGNGKGRPYIQSVTWNGKPWTKSWISHAELIQGGTLLFVMGDKPNPSFGSAPADRPPSFGKPASEQVRSALSRSTRTPDAMSGVRGSSASRDANVCHRRATIKHTMPKACVERALITPDARPPSR